MDRTHDDLLGSVLAARYRVLERLGEGDLGTVYGAKDVTQGRHVALKVLRPEVSRAETFVARFPSDQKTASLVEHRGLVRIVGYGVEPVSGRAFVARDLTGGADAARFVAARGPLDAGRATRVALDVLDALQVVHERGLLHGRLTSRKVRLEGGQPARVTGLGIGGPVVPRDPSSGFPVPTASATALAYRAPEQVRGEAVDPRADVYAVGVLLSELLDGHAPISARTTQELALALVTEPDPRPDRPPALDEAVRRALARRPQERFADARSFARALADALR